MDSSHLTVNSRVVHSPTGSNPHRASTDSLSPMASSPHTVNPSPVNTALQAVPHHTDSPSLLSTVPLTSTLLLRPASTLSLVQANTVPLLRDIQDSRDLPISMAALQAPVATPDHRARLVTILKAFLKVSQEAHTVVPSQLSMARVALRAVLLVLVSMASLHTVVPRADLHHNSMAVPVDLSQPHMVLGVFPRVDTHHLARLVDLPVATHPPLKVDLLAVTHQLPKADLPVDTQAHQARRSLRDHDQTPAAPHQSRTPLRINNTHPPRRATATKLLMTNDRDMIREGFMIHGTAV